MIRRFLTSSAIAALVLAPLAVQAMGIDVMINGRTTTLVDVSNSAWFTSYVKAGVEAGILTGYQDPAGNPTGHFKPENSITVAEALKIASEGAGYDESAYATSVASWTSDWTAPYISVSSAEKFPVVVRGMKLSRSATRAEVAALITAAFRAKVETQVSNRYKDVNTLTTYGTAIEALSRDAVVQGDTSATGEAVGTFRPTALINRAEVTKMVMEARTIYGTPGAGRSPSVSSSSASQK